jgi:hypothetical protein
MLYRAIEELNIRGLSPMHTPSQSVFGIEDPAGSSPGGVGLTNLSPYTR